MFFGQFDPSLPRRRVVAVPDITSDLPGAVGLTLIDVDALAGGLLRFSTSHWSKGCRGGVTFERPVTADHDSLGDSRNVNGELFGPCLILRLDSILPYSDWLIRGH